LVIVALPIALYLVVNEFNLPSVKTPFLSIPRLPGVPRYHTLATVFTGNGLSALWENLRTFKRLLFSGDDGLIWNAIPGFGYMYAFGLPLALLGITVTVSRRKFWRSPVEFFFLAWLVASVVLAASEPVNINRINIVFLPMIFFAAVGICAVATSRVILAAIIAYHCLAFLSFTHTYFGSYRAQASPAFFASFGDAINKAASGTSGPICITALVNEPYIFVLFYRKTDPHIFLRSVHYERPRAAFRGVSSFGRYTFGVDRCDAAMTQAYVVDQSEERVINKARFSTEDVGRYVVALRR
jgi:hypothetical protein